MPRRPWGTTRRGALFREVLWIFFKTSELASGARRRRAGPRGGFCTQTCK
jgi:hypothetical protein